MVETVDLFLLEEEKELNENINLNYKLISKWSLKNLKCDILFVNKKENIINFINDINYNNHNLFETLNISYIIINDINLLNLIYNNFKDILISKIDEDFESKNIFKFFRINEYKLFTIIKNFKNFYYIEDKNGEYISIDKVKCKRCYDYFNVNYNIKHYEKDINKFKRYAIELSKLNKFNFKTNYRVINFDIETMASVDCVNTPGAIISIASNDNLNNEFKTWHIENENIEEEKIMLEDFFNYVKKFDVISGFNCLYKDTEIITENGIKKIIDINIGDSVLTYNKFNTFFTKVKDKRVITSENNIRLKIYGNKDIVCSNNHKLLCFNNDMKFVFKRANNITKKDFLIRPKKINIRKKYSFNNELCYLAGLIFTDGHIDNNKKNIRIYSSKIKHVHKLIKKYKKYDKDIYYGKHTKNKVYYIKIRNKKLVEYIINLGVASGSKTKNISDFNKILNSTNNNIKAFIAGAYDGDGCYFSISNKSLGIEYIKYMFNKLGICFNYKKRVNNTENIRLIETGIEDFIKILKEYSMLEYRKNKALKIFNKVTKYKNNNYKKVPLSIENSYLNIFNIKDNDYNNILKIRKKLSFIPNCYNKLKYKNNYSKNYFYILNNIKILNKNKKLLSNKSIKKLYILNKLLCDIKNIDFLPIYNISKEGKCQLVDIETENNVFIADTIVSHNCQKFDLPYLINRAIKIGADVRLLSSVNAPVTCKFKGLNDNIYPWFIKIIGINIVDLYQSSIRATAYLDVKLPDSKLDTFGKYILGETKVEADTPAVLFKNKEFNKLVEYNLQDVNIAVKLDKKLGILDLLISTLEFVPGLNLEDSNYNSKIIDFYLLSKFNIVLPTINREVIPNIEGAIVFEPVCGIHNNVAVFDISGMYPSLIRTFNISPDMLNSDGDINIGSTKFISTEKGILVKLVDDFTNLRLKYKKLLSEHKDDNDYKLYQLREFATKKILSSIYGVFGFTGFRLFNNKIANAVTYSGRELLIWMKEFSEKNGYEVIIGDTDSIFIKKNDIIDNNHFKVFCDDINNNIIEYIKKFTNSEYIIKNNKLKIEYETLFKIIIIPPAKKKYIGLTIYEKGKMLDKPHLYFKGSELNKKDVPVGLKKEIENIVLDILNSDNNVNNINTIKLIKDRIKLIKKNINNIDIDDLLIYKEINRDFNSYKVKPQHVRAAENSNKYLNTNFSREDYKGGILYVNSKYKVEVLFIKPGMKLSSDFKVDYNKYYNKFILEKIRLIFGDEIYNKVINKNMSLSDFNITKSNMIEASQ